MAERRGAIRIGVVGKTGSGKTTVSALLAMLWASRGRRVVAVDTDVCPNLGASLGLGQPDPVRWVPRALAVGRGGGSLVPERLLEAYAVDTPSGVALVHAMPASEDAPGCGCPAHSSRKSLLADALDRFDVAVLDMEAGLQHLDRHSGTLAHVDALVVVAEPSHKSALVAERLLGVARSRGIGPAVLAGNKVRPGGDDAAFLTAAAERHGVDLAAMVPLSPAVADADRTGAALELPSGQLRGALERVADLCC